MKEYTDLALDAAAAKGATYADVRIVAEEGEEIIVRNEEVEGIDSFRTLGFGIRAVANGRIGFACSPRLNRKELKRVGALAVSLARSASRIEGGNVSLLPEPVYQVQWKAPFQEDPFLVDLGEKVDLLFQINRVLRKKSAIAVAESRMNFLKRKQWMATSEGSFIAQDFLYSGAGYSATAVHAGETQKRSFPNGLGGQHILGGYELICELPLLENAPRIRDEAILLLKAPQCPSGERDILLDGSQLSLQIHESLGHPSELDRVLGYEASFAGTSFLTLEKRGSFRYGSEIVHLVADATLPRGLGTFGYDDDAVKAQRWHLVKDGIFQGYLTSREVGGRIGEARSRGASRADGWKHIPLIRMVNISLLPGSWGVEDLLADTEGGIWMETIKTWSIDERRLNFQFTTEAGWEIKKGKKARLLKNCTYQGITPDFWNSCDAICNEEHWVLWGVPNCGKGQPLQIARISHGASPARFRSVTVGVRP